MYFFFFKLFADQLLVWIERRLRSKIFLWQRNCAFWFRLHHQVHFGSVSMTSYTQMLKITSSVLLLFLFSLQCRRILGGRKLVNRIATMKPPSLILWQRKIGESRNSNPYFAIKTIRARPMKTSALQASFYWRIHFKNSTKKAIQ